MYNDIVAWKATISEGFPRVYVVGRRRYCCGFPPAQSGGL
jgi:hypothetical protein